MSDLTLSTQSTPITLIVESKKLVLTAQGKLLTLGFPIPIGGGEANTASNVGAGAGVFKQKTGANLELRSLVGGTNVTVTENPDEIDISVTAIGDVIGPAGATDEAIARYDGATGKLLQDSLATIDDSGNIATPGTVDGRDVSVDGAALDSHIADLANPHAVTFLQAGADPAGAAAAVQANLTLHEADTANPHLTSIANIGSGTLAQLNAAVSDATLDDSSDPRTPTAHASTHENGGSDEIDVGGLSGVLADPQTAAAHAASHQDSGADEVAVAASAANAIPKANASGQFAAGWIDDASHGNRGGGTLHAVAIASGAAGFFTGADKAKLDGYPADPTGINHNTLQNLAVGDVHTQLALLAGRASGQTLIGGINAGDQLDLVGSSHASGGRVHVASPFELEYGIGNTPAEQYAMRWRPVFTTGGAYIGGLLNTTQQITYNSAVFVYGLIFENGTYKAAASPGFAAFTLFNAAPIIENAGNFDLVQALVLNAAPTHRRITAGTSVATQSVGLSFSPSTRSTVSGAVMTKTLDVAVSCAPTFSSITGSTTNMGTTIGVRCSPPSVALFQPATGVETYTAYYGVDFLAMTHTTSGDKVVVRSAMTAAADRYFLQNNGGAQSDFGGGFILDAGLVQILSDSLGVSLGAAGGDLQLLWDGTRGVFDPLTGDNLWMSFASGAHTIQSATFGSTASEIRFGFDKFSIGQIGAVGNQVGVFVAGARTTTINGGWADYLLTQAAALQVEHSMGQVYGWALNAPSMTLGAGSVSEAGALLIGGNVNQGTNRYGLNVLSSPSGGTLNYCARFQGAAGVRVDGPLEAPGVIYDKGYDEIAGTVPTTSATLEDITGLTFTVTVPTGRTGTIRSLMTLETSSVGANVVGAWAISINSVDKQEIQRTMGTATTQGSVAVQGETTGLSAGTYTVKGRHRRVSGATAANTDVAQLSAMMILE